MNDASERASRVRRSSADDWRTLRDLRLRSLREDAHAFGSSFEREAGFDEAEWRRRAETPGGDPRGAAFFAFKYDEPVGLAACIPQDEPAPSAWVHAMWIAPSVRGEGLGEALLRACIHHARAHALPEVRLVVHDDNRLARRLYEAAGFTPVEPTDRRLAQAERDLELRLRLDAKRDAARCSAQPPAAP